MDSTSAIADALSKVAGDVATLQEFVSDDAKRIHGRITNLAEGIERAINRATDASSSRNNRGADVEEDDLPAHDQRVISEDKTLAIELMARLQSSQVRTRRLLYVVAALLVIILLKFLACLQATTVEQATQFELCLPRRASVTLPAKVIPHKLPKARGRSANRRRTHTTACPARPAPTLTCMSAVEAVVFMAFQLYRGGDRERDQRTRQWRAERIKRFTNHIRRRHLKSAKEAFPKAKSFREHQGS